MKNDKRVKKPNKRMKIDNLELLLLHLALSTSRMRLIVGNQMIGLHLLDYDIYFGCHV